MFQSDLKDALLSYGITNEKELDDAIRLMKVDIGMFLKGGEANEDIRNRCKNPRTT